MEAPVWCELVCRDCASTIAGRFAWDRLPKREMRAFAKAGGWEIDLDGDWLCRGCARALKATAA